MSLVNAFLKFNNSFKGGRRDSPKGPRPSPATPDDLLQASGSQMYGSFSSGGGCACDKGGNSDDLLELLAVGIALTALIMALMPPATMPPTGKRKKRGFKKGAITPDTIGAFLGKAKSLGKKGKRY